MSKIGRNETCHCGSQLKYKKCCLNKTAKNISFDVNSNIKGQDFFSQFNKKELLATIALLKSLPQNHGKNIRLEEIQKKVLQTENQQNKYIDYKKLNEYLSKNYSFNYQVEKPVKLTTTFQCKLTTSSGAN